MNRSSTGLADLISYKHPNLPDCLVRAKEGKIIIGAP